MKKQQLDHVLRAAGRVTGEKQFVIIGSQALHGKHPDLADDIVMSAEVDLIASRNPGLTARFSTMQTSLASSRDTGCTDCLMAQPASRRTDTAMQKRRLSICRGKRGSG